MKALVIGLVLVVLAALGAVLYFSSQNSPQTSATPKEITASPNQEMMVIDDKTSIETVQTVGGEYAELPGVRYGFYGFYTQSEFEASTASKKILFFFADWCPTCKTADEDFQSNLSKLPEDIAVFKVHYNDPQTSDVDKKLAAKYGITYQHTFVQVDEDGNEITKWNGGSVDKMLTSIK